MPTLEAQLAEARKQAETALTPFLTRPVVHVSGGLDATSPDATVKRE